MNSKATVQETKPRFDFLKWLLILVLLIGGIIANYYFSNTAWAIRAAVGIVIAVVILFIASQTAKGRKALGVIKGARTELRKVVWPTRQETVQTTLVVVAMVVVTALLLWGIDSLFMWAIGWLTGQRG
ncbi:preprotein translocase subunit SecE [Candidiatus Paracoxiella cheracis]|uniref:preprotein translocase subunit SecE n=1 Tax=Candidiatus Paracoxiella cheracis TaxID=3405120 RepID=UPI003BF5910D